MEAAIGTCDSVQVGRLTKARHGGTTYLLTKVGEVYYAIEDQCPHLGLSMARGEITDGAIKCPWHGSRYDVCSGKNLDWVSGVVGIPMPKWTHKIIALGKTPAPVKSTKLIVDGEHLRFP